MPKWILPLFALSLFAAQVFALPITALIPSQPGIESAEKNGAQGEIDVLMSLLKPHGRAGVDMDMPQFFAAIRYPENFGESSQTELLNLLGDVEEIRYLDKKAWGANVAIDKPGLYQFILEAKPWWDAAKKRYLWQQAKVIVPAFGVDNGWNAPFGQSFEILPLTRPFGLTAPALFSARLMLDGKPLENVAVHMGRIDPGKSKPASKWHENLEAMTDHNGQFAFVLNQPGWWHCEASIAGAPLKGPDGEMREMDRSTVLWLYVDPLSEAKAKK